MIVTTRNRITVDPRAKIKTGKMGKSREGKDIPKALDYFNIEPFPELVAAYGAEPKMLIVYPPTDNLTDVIDDEFCLWARKEGHQPVKIRSCNGETCIHRISEEIAGAKYGAGEETACICEGLGEKDKKRCKYSCYLKAYVGLPPDGRVDNMSCYLFETHSVNSGRQMVDALKNVQEISGRLKHIPFRLSVKMSSGRANASEKFPLWSLSPAAMLSHLRSDRTLTQGGIIDQAKLLEAADQDTTPDPELVNEPEDQTPTPTPTPATTKTEDMAMEDHLLESLNEINRAPTREKLVNWKMKFDAYLETSGKTETNGFVAALMGKYKGVIAYLDKKEGGR